MSSRWLRYERGDMDDARRRQADAVADLASRLDAFLESRAAEIDSAHIHGAGSKKVQDIVGEFLEPLGFLSEHRVSGPGDYAGAARADFFWPDQTNRGILVEVERGGVHTNNHDLKDLWKAHLSPEVQHLFLIVPMANWNEKGTTRERPFGKMDGRFSAFFAHPDRWIDLTSLHIFGYGPTYLTPIDAV